MDETRAVVLSGRSLSQHREIRDPRGATRQIGWYSRGQMQIPEWNDELAVRQGLYGSWVVNRCVEIIADSIAKLPFRAGADPDKPLEFNTKAPLAKLLGPPPGNPNPEFSARRLISWMVKCWLVSGRFGLEIESANGIPIGLWPLVTGSLFPIPSDGTRAYFAGFKYRVSHVQTGYIDFTRDQVVYGWEPSLADPRQAVSPLQSLRLPVSIQIQLDTYTYSFMRNDATPATLIITAPFEDAETKGAFQSQLNAEFRGPANAGKAALLEVDPDTEGGVGGMIDVKQLGASAKDSQLLQTMQEIRGVICSGLGVPESYLDASGRTFDNASQENVNFEETRVMPLALDIADVINRDLAGQLSNSDVGWFDFTKLQAVRPKPSPGIVVTNWTADLTRDERRNLLGFGPADPADFPPPDAFGLPAAPNTAGLPNDTAQPAPAPIPPVVDKTNPPAPSPPAIPPARPALRTDEDETRHGGPEGHTHVPSGHAKDRIQAAAAELMRRRKDQEQAWSAVVPAQQPTFSHLLSRMAGAVASRAANQRGRRVLADPAAGIERLLDTDFWHSEARVWASGMCAQVAGIAAGHDVAEGLLRSWATQRAEWIGDVVVQAATEVMQATLDACRAEAATDLDERLAAVEIPVSLSSMVRQSCTEAFALGGLPKDSVHNLLERLDAGEVDLDAAMKELA